jgi:hypothetical protein
LQGTEASLNGALSTMQSGLDKTVADVGVAIVEKTEALELGIAKSVLDLAAALGSRTDDLKAATGQAVSELSSEVAKISGSHQAIGIELRAFTSASATSASDTQLMLERLNELVVRLDAGLSAHDSALQSQVSELTAARDAAERLLRQFEVAADLGRNGASV